MPIRLPYPLDAATATPPCQRICSSRRNTRLADAELAARFGHLRIGLDFFEDANDLFFAELRLPHVELLVGETLLLSGSNQRGRFNVCEDTRKP